MTPQLAQNVPSNHTNLAMRKSQKVLKFPGGFWDMSFLLVFIISTGHKKNRRCLVEKTEDQQIIGIQWICIRQKHSKQRWKRIGMDHCITHPNNALLRTNPSNYHVFASTLMFHKNGSHWMIPNPSNLRRIWATRVSSDSTWFDVFVIMSPPILKGKCPVARGPRLPLECKKSEATI